MLANFGPGHWAVLAFVGIVIFGYKRLPDAARSLGKSMRIFKSEVHQLQHDGKPETPATTAPVAAPTPVASERVDTPAAPPSGPAPTDVRPA